MKHFLTSILALICSNLLFAQQAFWQPTAQSPTYQSGTGNISIAIGAADVIFTGTVTEGIFRSTDAGLHWENTLTATDTAIVKIWSDKQGKLFAIGANVVFSSADNGNSWARNVVPTNYPITDIAVLSTGRIIVCASSIVDSSPQQYEYFGDGIFVSDDGGNTWTQKNSGIAFNKAITHLAASSGNVLVAAMAGFNNQAGGLYYSTNQGQDWTRTRSHPSYKSGRDQRWYAPSSIYETFCLEFDEHDRVHFSFEGIAFGNTSASGGVSNTLSRLLVDSSWEQVRINQTGWEWNYHPFHSMHRAKKQDHFYSGLHTPNSTSYGGAYLHNGTDSTFKRINSGVIPVNSGYLKMLYAENSEGRIYAVQYTDHQVYYTDFSKGFPSAVREDVVKQQLVTSYPNPAAHTLTIECDLPGNKIQRAYMLSMGGKICFSTVEMNDTRLSIPVQELNDGMYILHVQTTEGTQQKKILIAR